MLRSTLFTPLRGLQLFAALSLLLGLEGRASAGWFLTDGLEPPTGWFFDGDGGHSGGFTTASYLSYSHSAKISSSGGGWSAVGRVVNIASFSRPCDAEIFVKSVNASQSVSLEVIDPATWTYVSLTSVTISSGAYRFISANGWTVAPYSDVVIRVAIGGPGTRAAYVDDLTVWCG